LFKAIAALTVIVVCAIFAVRQFMAKQLTLLQAEPENAGAIARWRGACIVGFALCEMVALYGFVLRVMGFTLTQVSPFYLGGIALMLLFLPRRPDSLDVTAG
jgi:F0F1-type ATP synthase membrane subunit c/vacuolar-type H+-ATPase subunit K